MITFLVFVGTILLLVGAHELGHFLAAKALGIGVLEFAIGFGPALWTWRRGKTTYSLRLFPLGGYTRLAGEGPEVGDFSPAETYYGRPAWTRFLVALAGPTFNVLLAFLLAFAGFLLIGLPRLRVAGLVPGKPAEEALRIGDVVLAVEDQNVWSTAEVGRLIQSQAPKPVRFRILRDGEELEVVITPVYSPEDSRYIVGAFFQPQVIFAEIEKLEPLSPLSAAGLRPGDVIVGACNAPVRSFLEWYAAVEEGCRTIQVRRGENLLTLELPADTKELFSGAEFRTLPMVYGRIGTGSAANLAGQQVVQAFSVIAETLRAMAAREIPAGEAVSGPVGIAGILSQGITAGPLVVLLLIAVISVNLALFNLLPIPALDGARMLFALFEMLTRKRVSPKVETLVHTLGFILLLGLLVLITARDILKLFG
ncbi:MAG: RIP metalloprotease RseP [Candidatus Bipolaricaulaceae bacterium]